MWSFTFTYAGGKGSNGGSRIYSIVEWIQCRTAPFLRWKTVLGLIGRKLAKNKFQIVLKKTPVCSHENLRNALWISESYDIFAYEKIFSLETVSTYLRYEMAAYTDRVQWKLDLFT